MITEFSRESIVGNSLWSWKILEQIQKRNDSRIRRAQVATSHLVIMEDINWGTPYYNKRRQLNPDNDCGYSEFFLLIEKLFSSSDYTHEHHFGFNIFARRVLLI